MVEGGGADCRRSKRRRTLGPSRLARIGREDAMPMESSGVKLSFFLPSTKLNKIMCAVFPSKLSCLRNVFGLRQLFVVSQSKSHT